MSELLHLQVLSRDFVVVNYFFTTILPLFKLIQASDYSILIDILDLLQHLCFLHLRSARTIHSLLLQCKLSMILEVE